MFTMDQSSRPYTGIFPVAPTPFTATGDLDLEGQRRVLDCMLDQGVDGICVLANYSEQFLLTDQERDTLADLCLSYVAGRSPVIVTCRHFMAPDFGPTKMGRSSILHASPRRRPFRSWFKMRRSAVSICRCLSWPD